MKSRIVIVLILLSGFSFAQDTNCIKSRWIALKNVDANNTLFDTTYSILKTIKSNVEANKMAIYCQGSNAFNRGEWYPIPYVEYEINKATLDTIYEVYRSNYFEIGVQSDIPLTDEYGDPRIVTLPDGTQEFVYPPAEIQIIDLDKITEIRIKEERVQNSMGEFYFKPTGMSFYMDYGQWRGRELFWVSVDELFKATSEIEAFPWYNFIVGQKHQGFQYMQVACEDEFIRY